MCLGYESVASRLLTTAAGISDSSYMRTAVALGSNLGDRLENLRAARRQIIELGDVRPPVFSAGIYETDPIDCEPGAPKFLNTVIEFDFESDPVQLLEQLARIEESLGRKRDHPTNVSRRIDIDMIYCGDQQIDNEQLQLPHPRTHLRKFVLQPLADIRPELILPDQKKTVADLLVELKESSNVARFMDHW
ncbi:MAG: 2-amino-4-hydroxy-6-hydroxymethyldihydropteridine diphosphokinase [Verrucomicrobia bacterium]|nr:MAG: 2-amino-4-hydroxy-6-hydroxymethyldihydropteridine diphosphokinase [Verrucomicrobiota bacterium]